MSLAYLITGETKREHRARWFVYAGPNDNGRLEKIPHAASMRGWWPGWDVTCSCGWESSTGGATRKSVADMLWDHRFSAQANAKES